MSYMLDSQRAGGQVCVLVLQLSIQSEASFLSVVGQKRSESENFTESWTGSNDVTVGRKNKASKPVWVMIF